VFVLEGKRSKTVASISNLLIKSSDLVNNRTSAEGDKCQVFGCGCILLGDTGGLL